MFGQFAFDVPLGAVAEPLEVDVVGDFVGVLGAA
jgi:hypothetical protein